jgi:ankyrin repeat protein
MSKADVFHAIYYDDIDALKKLSGEYSFDFFSDGAFPETPLIYAVMMKKDRLVDFILNKKADMYARNIFGDTAFHLAAKKGFLEIVKSFCEHGVSIDVVGQDGFTSLNYAINFGFDNVAAYLIEHGASLNISDNIFHKTPLDRIREKMPHSGRLATDLSPDLTGFLLNN